MTDRTEQQIRADIVAEAYSWLRTPYRHEGAIKGVGTDCAMLLVCVYRLAVPGLLPEDFDPRPYPAEWYLHQDEERYLDILRQFAVQIPNGTARPGDIETFNFGRHAAHGGIVVDDRMLIHAYRPHGNVELHERAAEDMAHRLHSSWSVFR